MSRDHLRKLVVVEKGSEIKDTWDCMMLWFWLLFMKVGLVPQQEVGIQKKIQ